MFRPISAVPVCNLGHIKYSQNKRRNLEIGADKDYSFNDGIFSIESIKSKEIKSFTSKNPGGKTSSTGMSSIDPTKIQAASRQQNHKFAVGVKSNKHKKTKSSAILNNSGEDCYSRDELKKTVNMSNILSDPSLSNFDKQICSINESKVEDSFAENVKSDINQRQEMSLDYDYINQEQKEEDNIRPNFTSLRVSKESDYSRVRFKKRMSKISE